MITATTWVPRGYAAAFPTKYVFDESEYGRIAKLAKLQLEDAEEDLAEARAAEEASKPKSSGSNGETGSAARDTAYVLSLEPRRH
jgi:periodic tryptophan protein 1